MQLATAVDSTELFDASMREHADCDLESMEGFAATLTPLTGRDTEVSLLADRWEQAHDGMGQVVLIVGEAGLGKSRLVHTAKQLVLAESDTESGEAAKPGLVIEWRCSQRSQNTELHPAAEHLARLLSFDREESTAARFDRLARHLEDRGLDNPQIVALFAKLLFLPPDQRFPAQGLTPIREREETFRALREWLLACSKRQPVLFVVEDLHWIDASSLEFLGQFIAEGLHDRILTVLTFRPEFRTPWPAVAHQTSLALNRLPRRQVAELIRKSAGGALPNSLVAQIYDRTNGVPLLVEEFIRMIRESAVFGREGSQEIPTTLQQLVIARLDRMHSNREVVQFAATLGREFQYEMLAAVVSVDEPTLQAELAKLADAEILFSKGSPPRCAYLFKHALLEEALHNTIEETQRRQFHRQVAEVMETRFSQSAERQPELLALHFTEAGMVEKAIEYWLRAGQRSHARFANIEAISHLNRALEMLRTQGESRMRDARELDILGPLGTAYIAARGYAAPEVGPIFERACALAERAGETTQTFAMMRGHFAYHIVRGDFRLCTNLAAKA
ncbi:MAG TPA: AAA family ATPase, partial [Chthoniobacteraceae bacterium]|nr:AAA family ATPase [Chthoniobacteraceae bacterium]